MDSILRKIYDFLEWLEDYETPFFFTIILYLLSMAVVAFVLVVTMMLLAKERWLIVLILWIGVPTLILAIGYRGRNQSDE